LIQHASEQAAGPDWSQGRAAPATADWRESNAKSGDKMLSAELTS